MASTLSVSADLLDDGHYRTNSLPKSWGMSGMNLVGRSSTSSVSYMLISDYNTSVFDDYTQDVVLGPELHLQPIFPREYLTLDSKQSSNGRTMAVRVQLNGKMDAVDTSRYGSLILEDATTANPLRRSRVVKARVTVVRGAPGSTRGQPQ